MESYILLKGTKEGIRCIFPEDEGIMKIEKMCDEVLKESGRIMYDSSLVIDLQGRESDEEEIIAILRNLVWPSGAKNVVWRSYDPKTRKFLKTAGFCIEEYPSYKGSRGRGLFIYKSLRSGQKVEHDSDVFIIGNVNDGSEVWASGNIWIWGKLQGVVHAGCQGDEEAHILAKVFESNQVRIGKLYSSIERNSSYWGKSTLIYAQENTLIFKEI
ncbi:septum site-determining protein MinC [Acetomicrobium sp.]|jgi:septum site-determining protein MinC|uniref:septum site-determining protein MinC n=1 Tax=Acetomicrobium sp. TaxID=1872099 RepID=UPI00287162D5|nr:septum site-determining protein MinC [Acetomicrobium sp.]MDR9770332.1 septum site-determining protein MinC [Acetomicrobium sp.]HPT64562.1 septum site-determining protein MinC [Acetomicrobium sp.]HXK98820.1 septum site-determining protein MinC [Acetomicrobium sp.]